MKILKAIIVLLIISILITLGYVYVKITSIKPKPFIVKEKIRKALEKPELKKPIVYNLPVRILFMKIDLRYLKKVILYRLTLDVNDKYGLFNVKILLDNNDIAYSLLEDRKIVRIYAVFTSLKQAKRIFDLFKKYNFNVKIEKITKRI
jgi:hypothetical protein